jgi:hypothetical protein
MACGASTLPAISQCVERGACADDLPGAVLAERAADGSAARVDALANALVEAVRAGRADRFVPRP